MENLLAFFFTWGIIGYAAYCFAFPPKDSYEISDRFDIGYIDEPPEKTVNVVVKKEKKKQKKKENPLLKDCSEVLFSLGVPKRKATAEANIILDKNPSIKTVQEFITEYGKR